ncbi:3-deoxy-D-manno-octulosonic-acid transferase [Chitinophaga sp. CF118]|uniref:3-deoxy-D-manno-octulosonic acid transferase n=1 Tax=Chitinophaga sp. CF118 TaxID=1884367 RepID=UPI0008EA01E4|nr:glycosyltransferase N-terminal domain-containing protein [Chitinophaga sp. CF118]SFE79012.1 3-deoxy-D-manno-octulosonic-acid transferase [Chitinophaga sp. CF118]
MNGTFLYNIGIQLYKVGVLLAAAAGNAKARLWLKGRRNWQQKMRTELAHKEDIVWIHAASLGEFEQGRPVLEAIRKEYPGAWIVLTFFSPSGYEVRKDYPVADHIYYLPLDTKRNAWEFVEIVQPRLAIFIKYEFWYNYLTVLHERNIPVLLISGIFRPDQIFFKFYGGMFRRLLQQLTYIFVQNRESLELLANIGVTHAVLSGDTRFDRVWALRKEAPQLVQIKDFIAGRKAVIAGSTWEADEKLLATWWVQHNDNQRCLIIAPHEIHEAHIQHLLELFPGATRFTEGKWQSSVLIIDNIGMLSYLYRYARVSYVGGGFGKDGIHNILEPATYGKPVVFGPVFHKYPEAAALLATGGGISIAGQDELNRQLELLLEDDVVCTQKGKQASQYVEDNKGVTDRIIYYIQVKRFLTIE